MPARATQPLKRARRWLARAVDDARRRRRDRLPTLLDAARMAGVSHVTLMKAVHELRDRRVLTVNQRSGIRIVGTQPRTATHEVVQQPGTKRDRIARLIRSDIAKGLYSPGSSLPPVKALRQRYGVAPATLARALESLVHEEILTPYKRGYRPVGPRAVRSGGTIVLVARGESPARLQLSSGRTFDHLRTLEQECMRANLTLAVVPCYHVGLVMHGEERVSEILKRSGSGTHVLGVMVWDAGLELDFLDTLVAVVDRAGKPVAVLEERGFPRSAWDRVTNAPMRRFSLALSTRPGEIMGRYLFALGHRRILFVYLRQTSIWAAPRLEGLQSVFSGYGSGVAVKPAVIDGRGVDERAEVPLLLQANQALDRYQRARHGDAFVQHAVRYGRIDSLKGVLEGSDEWLVARRRLFRDLRSVAEDRSITAWVGANDGIALDCLDLLRSSGRHVPGDCSLAGFDDAEGAGAHRLTSYSFNGAAYIRTMMEFLLRPGWSRWKSSAGAPIEIDGLVMERGTTATPPQSVKLQRAPPGAAAPSVVVPLAGVS